MWSSIRLDQFEVTDETPENLTDARTHTLWCLQLINKHEYSKYLGLQWLKMNCSL